MLIKFEFEFQNRKSYQNMITKLQFKIQNKN